MRNPGFEDIADSLKSSHPEGDNQRSVRPFLYDLLSREHLPPLEVMTNLGIDRGVDDLHCSGALGFERCLPDSGDDRGCGGG